MAGVRTEGLPYVRGLDGGEFADFVAAPEGAVFAWDEDFRRSSRDASRACRRSSMYRGPFSSCSGVHSGRWTPCRAFFSCAAFRRLRRPCSWISLPRSTKPGTFGGQVDGCGEFGSAGFEDGMERISGASIVPLRGEINSAGPRSRATVVCEGEVHHRVAAVLVIQFTNRLGRSFVSLDQRRDRDSSPLVERAVEDAIVQGFVDRPVGIGDLNPLSRIERALNEPA